MSEPYRPSLQDLQALERKAPEQTKNLREIAQGWSQDDARWDALLRAIEFHKREVAHELADKIRAAYAGDGPDGDNWIMNPYDAAELIDPEVPGG